MHTLISETSAIMRLLRVNAERGMAQEGLGFPEQMVLMTLYPDKACNQDTIARMLGVDKGAIARTMTKLEDKGLIRRTPNPANRRENIVSLAPESAPVLEGMKANMFACIEQAFDGFEDDERQRVLDALARIADNLKDDGAR